MYGMSTLKRRTYTQEFRIQAVERYLENDRNLKATAEELDVHPATMKHWIQKGIDGLKEPVVNRTLSMEAEIRRLRKEINRLTEENEILIKAARMFAAQP